MENETLFSGMYGFFTYTNTNVEGNRRGRPSDTWMSIIKKDLEDIGINIDYTKPEDAYNKLINITHDMKII